MDKTAELVVIDADAVDAQDDSLGKEIAKSLVISTAASAGTVIGLVAVAFAVDKFKGIARRRAEKKAEKNVETETPEKNES